MKWGEEETYLKPAGFRERVANVQGESGERAGEKTETMMERQWRGRGKQMSDTEQHDTVVLMEVAHTCLVRLQ